MDSTSKKNGPKWSVPVEIGRNGQQTSKLAKMVSSGQKWPKWSVEIGRGRTGQYW